MATGEILATTLVALQVEEAFSAFTDDIDRWWRRDRARPDAIVQFEADRLVAVSGEGATLLAVVERWSPPSLLELRWHGPHAQDGDLIVIEWAPEGAGTRVTVRHRREGLSPTDAAAAVLGLWWADLLRGLAAAHRPRSWPGPAGHHD